jgi:O-antigen ligase
MIQDTKNLLIGARSALLEAKPSDRFFLVLWLLGPFFLLIERTPGDVWLSFLAVSFFVRAINAKEFEFLKFFWVRAIFLFWCICLISAGLSKVPLYALGETISWIRFPLFAMASVFWLGTDRRLVNMMLLTLATAFLIMCFILLAEVIVEGFKTRLSWPYGDLVPGNFLAKAGMPVITIASALAVSELGKKQHFAMAFIVIGVVFVVLTGERINSLTLILGAAVSAFCLSNSRMPLLKLLSVILVLVIGILFFQPGFYERYVINFLAQLPFDSQSSYYNTMAAAVFAFTQDPIFGVGTASLRVLCADFIILKPAIECDNHPHNYYLQLLGETGILGFVSGVTFIIAIGFACVNGWKNWPKRSTRKVAWVIPFALFWPLASTADFFGQWNNIFLWSAIALALSISQYKIDSKDDGF